MGAVRAVLLDLDGTLLDTAPEIAAAAADMLSELGLDPVDPLRVREFIGKGIPHLVRRTLEASLGRVPDERRVGSAMEGFFFHYAKRNGCMAKPYPGVLEGLTELRAKGFALACVTNKTAQFTIPLLEATGLAGFFPVVVSGDTMPKKKPAPDPLLEACRRLGVPVREALMVGDSRNDALAARAAGCPVLLVPYGYTEGEDVQGIDCDGIVPSLLHVAGLLKTQS
ncbi:MAG: phosphoglycolate phosphatase [Betaproteobacteria bacterium]|nr:phosphoglycolate phosphatase [Betaproteobacteria bacterium]